MSTFLHIKLLGSLKLTLNNVPLRLKSRKGLALLIYLAVTRQSHPRSTLANLLWGDFPEANARANLRKVLSHLRPKLGDYLHITDQIVGMNTAVSHTTDLFQFVAAADKIVQANNLQPRLVKNLSFYQGAFLGDFDLREAAAFEDWTRTQREMVQQKALSAYQKLARLAIQQQAYEVGIEHLRRFLQIQPWQEYIHRQLMQLLALNNDRAAALMQYQRCVTLLQKELNISPDQATTTLYQQIAEGRFSTTTSHVATEATQIFGDEPMVARSNERQRLSQLLPQSTAPNGALLFIIGEAGIGKTALLRAFVQEAHLQRRNLLALQGQCNAFSGNGDAYLPFREIMLQLLDTAVLSPPHTAKLPSSIDIILQHGSQLLNTLLPSEALLKKVEQIASQNAAWRSKIEQRVNKILQENQGLNLQQTQLFEQFTLVMGAIARQRPLTLIIDDLQWADRGSIDLLFHLCRRLQTFPILLLGAYRPEALALEQAGQPHPLQRVVNELQRQLGDIFLDLNLAAKRPFIDAYLDLEANELDETFRTTLFHQTGGHPLFTVELLRGLQERKELVKNRRGQWVSRESLNWKQLPARVEGAIAERINRLSPSLRRLLTTASVIGEYFSAEILAQVLGQPEITIISQLSQELQRIHRLVRARDLSYGENGRFSTYQFRHILIQNYLYEQLDPIEKGALHEAVANAYEQLHPNKDNIANTLVRHYQLAHIPDKAITYLQKAAVQAIHRFAVQEAITLINQAQELVKILPDEKTRNKLELNLLLLLGPVLLSNEGFSGRNVMVTYSQAHKLSQITLDKPNQFDALSGLWIYYFVKGDQVRAVQLSKKFWDLSQKNGSVTEQLAAHFAMVGTHFFNGHFDQCLHFANEAENLYKIEFHRELFQRFGHDPGLACAYYHAFSLAFLGYPDQSLVQAKKTVKINRKIGNPYNLSYALSHLALIHHIRNEPKKALEIATEAISLSSKNGFVQWLAQSSITKGWCLVQLDQAKEGLDLIERGLVTWRDKLGADLAVTHYLWVQALAYNALGELDRSVKILNDAISVADRHGRFWLADVYRTKAVTLHQLDYSDAIVEQHFSQALQVARVQNAKLFELRAANSLAQFYLDKDQHTKARACLLDLLDWFTEGFATADLQKAQALLQQTAAKKG